MNKLQRFSASSDLVCKINATYPSDILVKLREAFRAMTRLDALEVGLARGIMELVQNKDFFIQMKEEGVCIVVEGEIYDHLDTFIDETSNTVILMGAITDDLYPEDSPIQLFSTFGQYRATRSRLGHADAIILQFSALDRTVNAISAEPDEVFKAVAADFWSIVKQKTNGDDKITMKMDWESKDYFYLDSENRTNNAVMARWVYQTGEDLLEGGLCDIPKGPRQ